MTLSTIIYPERGTATTLTTHPKKIISLQGFQKMLGPGSAQTAVVYMRLSHCGCDASIKQLKGLNGEELIIVIVLFCQINNDIHEYLKGVLFSADRL